MMVLLPMTAMGSSCAFSELFFPHLTSVGNNCFTDILEIKHLRHKVCPIIASIVSTFFWEVPYSLPPSKCIQNVKPFLYTKSVFFKPYSAQGQMYNLIVVRLKAQELHIATMFPIKNTRDKEKTEKEMENSQDGTIFLVIFNSLNLTVSKTQTPAASIP